MNVVYKYPVLPGSHILELPLGTRVLHADLQRDECFLWAAVNPDQRDMIERRFVFTGTGHRFDSAIVAHIASFLSDDDSFVGHVFEVVL